MPAARFESCSCASSQVYVYNTDSESVREASRGGGSEGRAGGRRLAGGPDADVAGGDGDGSAPIGRCIACEGVGLRRWHEAPKTGTCTVQSQ